MFKRKESILIVLILVLITLILSFQNSNLYNEQFLKYFIISIVILGVSIITKKMIAYKIDTKLEMKLWQFKRYGLPTKSYLEKPIPIGVLLPLLLSFISGGMIKFLAFFTFNAEAMPSKVSKRYGTNRYQEVNDWDYALIAFYSLLAMMVLSVACTILAPYLPAYLSLKEIAKLSLYFTISNLIPIGQLDGIRIFFSSRPLYIFSLILLVITALIVFL